MENFTYNQRRVKEIDKFMKELLYSKTSAEKVKVYRKYEPLIEEISPLDMFSLHNYSYKSDLTIDEIKETANRFINVFFKGLEKHSQVFNHVLLKTLNKESDKIESHLNVLKVFYKSKEILKHRTDLLSGFKKALEYELKFIKFENIVFPNLEGKLPSTKPFEVLWSLHDDARRQVKYIIHLLEETQIDEQEIIQAIGEYYYLVFGINQKEKLVILPLLEKLLTTDKLDEMYNECIEYGFVFMEKPEKVQVLKDLSDLNYLFKTKTGELTQKELRIVMAHIPVDITFVDRFDRVRYFNDRKERHFPRNPSVIGRLVKHCHPPKSVAIVERIIDDFKNNKKISEDFWIEINKTFLYITYHAIKDENGIYLGVLEVSQDVTKIRSLEGEKRLL